jgi:hypothetical protein
MNIIRILFLIIIVLTTTMCNNHKKYFKDNLSECISTDANADYDKLLYPFCLDSIDYKTALNVICEGVKIDTFRFTTHDKKIDNVLRISDSKSEMKFYIPNYKKSKNIYYSFEYSISSNLIKYGSGIYIGMERKEFFKNLKVKYSECDTFLISGKSEFYHRFLFEKNQLKRIERLMPEM